MRKFTQLFEHLSWSAFTYPSGSRWVMDFAYSADGRSITYRSGVITKTGEPYGCHFGTIPEDAIDGATANSPALGGEVLVTLRLRDKFPYEYQDAVRPGMRSVMTSSNNIGLLLKDQSEADYVISLVNLAVG